MAEERYIDMKYYSKSKAFLYPVLGYRRVEAFKCNSYLFFEEHAITNGELIVRYDHEGELYRSFEQERISPHPLLRACYKIAGGSVYIFDISGRHSDIDHFLRGEYSKFSTSMKKLILNYFGDNIEHLSPRSGREIHAVLFPEGYRPLVAKQLGDVPVENLTELASLYDLDKETLDMESFDCRPKLETTTPA